MNKLNKFAQKLIHVHYSRKSRRIFKWTYIGCLVGLFLLFLISGIMLYFSGSLNSTKDDFDPAYPNWKMKSIVLLTFGLLFFIIAFASGIIMAYIYPCLYKTSREMYFQTDKYKKLCLKYEDQNLKRYKPKDLKWLLKLGYIDKTVYVRTIESKKKTKKKK